MKAAKTALMQNRDHCSTLEVICVGKSFIITNICNRKIKASFKEATRKIL
jgi:hypothetical protein